MSKQRKPLTSTITIRLPAELIQRIRDEDIDLRALIEQEMGYVCTQTEQEKPQKTAPPKKIVVEEAPKRSSPPRKIPLDDEVSAKKAVRVLPQRRIPEIPQGAARGPSSLIGDEDFLIQTE
jgi:hypothetical protein